MSFRAFWKRKKPTPPCPDAFKLEPGERAAFARLAGRHSQVLLENRKLKEENQRLQERIANQRRELARLNEVKESPILVVGRKIDGWMCAGFHASWGENEEAKQESRWVQHDDGSVRTFKGTFICDDIRSVLEKE